MYPPTPWISPHIAVLLPRDTCIEAVACVVVLAQVPAAFGSPQVRGPAPPSLGCRLDALLRRVWAAPVDTPWLGL